MGELKNLVSIVTPCYNGAAYVNKLLNSILEQSYPNVEMFVVDDGSKDDSSKIIKSYISKFKKRGYTLTYIHQDNQGQSAAINNALKLVNGEYLVWPDADDYYAEPNAIEKMVKLLCNSDNSVSMVRVEYNILDENGEVIGHQGVNSETRYKVNLFEDALFGENGFWYPPGGYMAKVAKIDELIPGREIYTERNAGQNFQIYFPLLYKQKCLTIEETLYNVVAHDDSHSRNLETNNARQKSYYRTIKNTLEKIDMPNKYRSYLLARVRVMIRNNTGYRVKNNRFRTVIKRFIKGLIPYGIIMALRRKGVIASPPGHFIPQQLPQKTTLEIFSDYDNQIFERGFAHGDFSQANIEGWLLFCSHVLEKAMSRVKFEAGHNFFRLEQIANLLNEYDTKGFDKNVFAYRYALSSVKEYVLLHKKYQFPTDKIEEILGGRYEQVLNAQKKLAGYKAISNEDKLQNQNLNFAELQNKRFSVREFSKQKINVKHVRQAIQLSMKAPSVCNRQPARVHIIMDTEKIQQILAIQGGFHGYELPSALLLVSVDTRNYVAESERNQAFIDGGSFAMSLLLSLEYYSLAACPLHAMFDPARDQDIREILDIQTPDYLIMFIAVGYFDNISKVAISSRYPASEITTEYL